MKRPEIIISGIGTGGHYFPAIVVAQEFKRRNIPVKFLVRKDYQEEEIAKKYGLRITHINAQPFYGKSIFNKISFIFTLLFSVYKLKRIAKNNIGIVFGGFGAIPLILVSLINRNPIFMFEPNCIPSRATRLFSSHVNKIFLGMPLGTELKGNIVITGIPLREEFKNIPTQVQNKHYILFIGGSQGARRLNELALEVQPLLPDYQLTIISGDRDYGWVTKRRGENTRVISFTTQPYKEIESAELIVSRAGALAGYEILAARKPVIFIPFPYAIDNHQYYNGRYFCSIGSAIMFEEKDITPEILAQKIKEMVDKKIKKRTEIIMDAEKRIANAILKEVDYVR